MRRTIFYSWQSDLPNSTNRRFIQAALERAAKAISAVEELNVQPVIDRDTSGVPGSPDIAQTIFAKIDSAAVFVCDVSLINESIESRPTPNPNVLIELGWAQKALGDARVVLVMNKAFGGPEKLPFDLKMKRVAQYDVPESTAEKSAERGKLTGVLTEAIRTILEHHPVERATEQPLARAIAAVQGGKPDAAPRVREFFSWLLIQLNEMAPERTERGEFSDAVVASLKATRSLMLDYSLVCNEIAAMNSNESAEVLIKSVGKALRLVKLPEGGGIRKSDWDYGRFLAMEMITTLFACLLEHDRWELIAEIISQQVMIEGYNDGPYPIMWIADSVISFSAAAHKKKCNVPYFHAAFVKELRDAEPLSSAVSFKRYMEADLLLFLRNATWRPWSALFLGLDTPDFLLEALTNKGAAQLVRALGCDNVTTLQRLLAERASALPSVFDQHALRSFWLNYRIEDVGKAQ